MQQAWGLPWGLWTVPRSSATPVLVVIDVRLPLENALCTRKGRVVSIVGAAGP